jgi:alpha-N-arabinofuranosidase
MKMNCSSISASRMFPALVLCLTTCRLRAAQGDAPTTAPTITINADQIKGESSPVLYGLMTEEINYSYEGGIYGELIRNRTFKADAKTPAFWNTVGNASISLDTTAPLNDALNVSLKLDATKATDASPVGLANGGYWGIPVKRRTEPRAR